MITYRTESYIGETERNEIISWLLQIIQERHDKIFNQGKPRKNVEVGGQILEL